jgi:predicted phosphodiesterase
MTIMEMPPMKPLRLPFFTRTFGAWVLATALFGAGPLAASGENQLAQTTNTPPNSAPLAITHGPFLQAPSETGVTISWATSRKCVSRVEYRPESSGPWHTNSPARHGLVDADVTRHNVALSGLEPGTRYRYRVVSREIVEFMPYKATYGDTIASSEGHFTTLDTRKPSFSFVAVNDRHERAAALAASLASVNWTNLDLVFLNGDMVNAATNEQQIYQCVVDPCVQKFAGAVPLVYVRGNHEARGSFARQLLDYFPTDSGCYYRTFNHGPVSFLVLDCGEDKADASAEYSGLVDFDPYLREQLRWMARQIEEMAFQSARFRVCFLHIPPLNKPDPKFVRPQWLLDNVVPLLNRGKVDLLICGHTHRYAIQAAGTNGLNFPMIIGGTETVIRCDVTADEIRVTSTDLSDQSLPQLPPIKVRTKQ